MPWLETDALDQRVRFIMDWKSGNYSMAALCRVYGISRPSGYKWTRRYADGGLNALGDRSRAPHRRPHAVPTEIEAAILAARRAHPTWGPKKLRWILTQDRPTVTWPACSTIGEILKHHGLSVPRKRRRRTEPSSHPFASCDGPNRVWCADFKGWFRTGDGRRCDPLTMTDGFSRFLLRCQAGHGPTLAWTRSWFDAAFRQFGLPEVIRTDNGTPFASRGIGGFSRLSVWWIRLGIRPERIDAGCPQQNGRHERMHLTLKRQTASPPARSLRAQQQRFDAFRREYNEDRPHEALGMATPASAYADSPRPYPARLRPLVYPAGGACRRVGKAGEFYWRHGKVFLGEAFAGETVCLEPVDDRYMLVYFSRYPLALFDRRIRRVVQGRRGVRLAVSLGLADPPEGSSATLQSLLADREIGDHV